MRTCGVLAARAWQLPAHSAPSQGSPLPSRVCTHSEQFPNANGILAQVEGTAKPKL